MKIVAMAALAMAVFAVTTSAALAEPTGTYLTQSKDTKVTFQPCGNSFCGIITWTESVPSVIGKQIIYDTARTGANEWKGKLWDYGKDKTYTGKMSLQGQDLKLSGCIVGGLICRSQVWKKVD